jgi:hypothetical protein
LVINNRMRSMRFSSLPSALDPIYVLDEPPSSEPEE